MIVRYLFYAAGVYAILCTFWGFRDLYTYWQLDAKGVCHIEEAHVIELSPSRFDILATYTFMANEEPCRATSALGKPYQLNPYSAAKVAEELKGSSVPVYYHAPSPHLSSLKRNPPMQSLVQAGLTLCIALYLWVLNLYAAHKQSKNRQTPLRKKYLIQNSKATLLMTVIDGFLSLLPKKKVPTIATSPKSFIVSNLAHMGDVLLTTSLLSVLKQNFPNAHIGVLIGSWSLPLIEGHPYVDNVHIVDHWKLNRSSDYLLKKIMHYYKTKKTAMKEMQHIKYEVAIDAYYYFPNAIPLFWQSKIPIRIGYTSGGFGPLLTHPVHWEASDQSVIQYFPALLDFLRAEHATSLKPSLKAPPPKAGSYYLQQKHKMDPDKEYIVIHMGTGSSLKEWPVEKWQELVKKLTGYLLIFTGKGERERENIEKVVRGSVLCINLADKLPWSDYVAIVQDARLLIGVDSVAGHVAATFNVPSVLLYSGMANPHHFAPLSPHCKIITHPVPCAPCYRSRGCASMKCIQAISPEEVYAHAQKVLSN